MDPPSRAVPSAAHTMPVPEIPVWPQSILPIRLNYKNSWIMNTDLSAEQVDLCLALFLPKIYCMTLYLVLPQFPCLLKDLIALTGYGMGKK